MEADAGRPVAELGVAAPRQRFAMQIQADLLQAPVVRAQVRDDRPGGGLLAGSRPDSGRTGNHRRAVAGGEPFEPQMKPVDRGALRAAGVKPSACEEMGGRMNASWPNAHRREPTALPACPPLQSLPVRVTQAQEAPSTP